MTVDASEYSSGRDTHQCDMPTADSDPEIAGSDPSPSARCASTSARARRVRAELTNTRVGVERATEDGSEQIEPDADHGAVAALTDSRAVFVVGQSDGDEVTSVPYVEFSGVDARTEMLARTLVVETEAGATWGVHRQGSPTSSTTSSEDLRAAIPERLLARAREHRDAAQTAVENGDCQARIDALEATVDAFRRATTVVDDPDIATAATREEAESAIDDLVCAHLARARNCRSVGNWSAEAGDAEDALDHFGDACDCFERALELAERYPPGDADAIAAEHEHLLEKCDAVEVSASVSSAQIDLDTQSLMDIVFGHPASHIRSGYGWPDGQ